MEEERDPDLTEAEMLSQAEVMLARFIDHKEDFFAFDPEQFNEEFIVQLEASIEIAYSLDEIVLERKRNHTEEPHIEVAIMDCMRAFSHLSYFILSAFGEDDEAYDSFGVDDFHDAMGSYPKLLAFIDNAVQQALSRREALLEVDCPASLIDSLPVLLRRLRGEDVDSEEPQRRGIIMPPICRDGSDEPWRSLSDIPEKEKPTADSQTMLGNFFAPLKQDGPGGLPLGGGPRAS